jgi:hypothetical protein
MSPDKLLKQGIAALKAGRKEEARDLLTQVVEQDERNEMAWLWLSGAVETEEERRICLENVLAINPNNGVAQRGLDRLKKKDASPNTELPKGRSTKHSNVKAEKDIRTRQSVSSQTAERSSASRANIASAKKKPRTRKRSIQFNDIVYIVATVVGAYSVLFAPWPFYVSEAAYSLHAYKATQRAGDSMAYAWIFMHDFGLIFWIPVILLSFLLMLLTLVSGRLRAGILSWLWLIVGILGTLYPSVFFLLDHVVNEGDLFEDIFLVWGFPLTFASYGSMALAAIASISQKKEQQDTQRVPCPYCAELIMPGAKICRFCGREIDRQD